MISRGAPVIRRLFLCWHLREKLKKHKNRKKLEKRQCVCMECGCVAPMSAQPSFERLTEMLEYSLAGGAEQRDSGRKTPELRCFPLRRGTAVPTPRYSLYM